eukprot:symbB.v1.2.038326.t1/scaffold5930.1/size22372/2
MPLQVFELQVSPGLFGTACFSTMPLEPPPYGMVIGSDGSVVMGEQGMPTMDGTGMSILAAVLGLLEKKKAEQAAEDAGVQEENKCEGQNPAASSSNAEMETDTKPPTEKKHKGKKKAKRGKGKGQKKKY